MNDESPTTGQRTGTRNTGKSLVWFAILGFIGAVLFASVVALHLIHRLVLMPASSMAPTLIVGDYVAILEIETRPLQRGDIVVFRDRQNSRTLYMKRIIGMPGDTVEISPQPAMAINSETVERLKLPHTDLTSDYANHATLYEERLGDRTYKILTGASSRLGAWTVPERHFFLLGDFRTNSRDSRFPAIGFVPEDRIVGRATWVVTNFSKPSRWFVELD